MSDLNEKAKSKSQQRLFGMVHKYLSETDRGKEEFLSNIKSKYDSDLAYKIKKIADGYDKDNDHNYIKAFAKTKHTNIPEKVDEIINFTEYTKITESLNDKHIFKAIFIIGAPGSGKSEFTKYFRDEFKIINVDAPTIYNLKLAQLDLDMTKIDDEIINTIRTKSKKQANALYKNCINNMLPLVLDCTGRSMYKIKNQNDILTKYGYDTYMIFINTTLETSLARDKSRNRNVGETVVKRLWTSVHNNISKYKLMFRTRFFQIDNNINDFNYFDKLKKIQLEILRSKPENHRSEEIIDFLRINKKNTISDFDDTINDIKL